jgi:DNA ligase D
MLIRKNTKSYKAIHNILYDYKNKAARTKLIKLYITKPGHNTNDKVSIATLNNERDFYYEMTYQTILNNMDSKDHQLHESDQHQGLYFFHNSRYQDWDETPFELDPHLRNKFSEFEKMSVKLTKEKKISHSSVIKHEHESKTVHLRPPIKRKEKTIEEHKGPDSKPESFPQLRLKEDRAAKQDHTRVSKKPKVILQEEKKLPDFKLKHPIDFHYLDKVLFPDQHITKLDLLNYYDQMAEYILPYLKERPQFFRWHKGSIRESQYNKSIESLKRDWNVPIPDWVQREKIYAKSYEEERTYILCPDKDHLLYLIEIGCVELSPWHSRTKSIEYPDYIIIDLDPLEIDFDMVVEVAQATKSILDGINVPSFIKTSGNKGLHIYIPLDAKSDYEICRSLCEFICKMIHLKIPNITSLLRIPEQRIGKVYLDYLQNSIGKSIAAPYCIRPNEFAAVATPLEWNEVKKGLSIYEFNYQTIFKRLKQKGDIFKDLFKKKINAKKMLQQLQERYGFLLNQ